MTLKLTTPAAVAAALAGMLATAPVLAADYAQAPGAGSILVFATKYDGEVFAGTFPGFTALLSHHRMFHHVACNVLALEQAGKRADARRMVADQFEAYSDRVTEDLRLLQQVVNQPRSEPGRSN